MVDRNLLAQMMARNAAGLPPTTANWMPGPTTPFGGLDAYNWKGSPQLGPPMQYQGEVPTGPTEQDIQLLHLLGRRRMSPALSGVGEVRPQR